MPTVTNPWDTLSARADAAKQRSREIQSQQTQQKLQEEGWGAFLTPALGLLGTIIGAVYGGGSGAAVGGKVGEGVGKGVLGVAGEMGQGSEGRVVEDWRSLQQGSSAGAGAQGAGGSLMQSYQQGMLDYEAGKVGKRGFDG